ncbi:hypothetical protein [Marinomonas sp. IMCC 4694]|uniref:hypothetical protein n=1 Tax=Marinomonas sp. IMCC 4694 TaxID=2605432 RepID=UPI0011E7ADC7|nr:hypothetical protein [Marinomonas sp. IMCC 4694]TYL48228.1 hypothetical protein FXV75_09920 [Marinomonas sp. IMCC 4694]
MSVISLFIVVCIAILTLAISRQIWAKKAFKQRSLSGISGILLFIKLIKITQQHRGMHSGFLSGNHDCKEKLNQLELGIDQLYKSLLAFETLHAYPASRSVQYPIKQWQRLMHHHTLSSAESFQLHSGLIARQLDAIWDMSDEFSLTSHPHENIRDAAKQLVKTLPELAESVGQVRALCMQIASKHEMRADKKLQLVFTLGKIEDHIKTLITPLPSLCNERLNQFISNINRHIQNSTLDKENPDILFEQATQVIDEIYDFIFIGFKTLEDDIS